MKIFYIICVVLFSAAAFIILNRLIFYPCFLRLAALLRRKKQLKTDFDFTPSVTVIVPKHARDNARSVLNNVLAMSYAGHREYVFVTEPEDRAAALFLREFIALNPEIRIRHRENLARSGDYIPASELLETVSTDIFAVFDSRCTPKINALSELAACFCDEKTGIVCGRVCSDDKSTAYGGCIDVYRDNISDMRSQESKLSSCADMDMRIYAARTADFMKLVPTGAVSVPVCFAAGGKRAVCNAHSVAADNQNTEPGGFLSLVRQNLSMLSLLSHAKHALNIFKCGLFSVFYFGRITCSKLLWLAHAVFFVTNVILIFNSLWFLIPLILQIIIIALLITSVKLKPGGILGFLRLYCADIAAQWTALANIIRISARSGRKKKRAGKIKKHDKKSDKDAIHK